MKQRNIFAILQRNRFTLLHKKTRMKRAVLSLALIVLVTACTSEQPKTDVSTHKPAHEAHQQAAWLLGRWENNSDQGNLSEIWKKQNDSLYIGVSYFVIAGDTVFSESVELADKNGEVNYIVTGVEGNEGAVPFKLKSSGESTLVFENPKHDFPQTITYTHKGDSVIAVISGKQNGKPKKEYFRMKKI